LGNATGDALTVGGEPFGEIPPILPGRN
jgi:hypothetical protein